MRSPEADHDPAHAKPKLASRLRISSSGLAAAFVLACVASGCAAPGPPSPPRTGIPRAVTGLTAQQEGAAVVLNFTLPTKSVTGDSLDAPPDVDLYRAPAPPQGGKPQFQLVVTVPGAAVESYVIAGKVQISDTLDAATLSRGANLVYSVRTRTSKKHASADSNLALVQLLLAPQAPTDFRAQVTESAILLTWTAPATDLSGAPISSESALAYHIYRAELELPAPNASEPDSPQQPRDLSRQKFKVPPALIGSPTIPEFRDDHFTFGASYIYTVRAVLSRPGNQGAQPMQTRSVESADSAPLFLTPKDIFPPTAPTGLVAAITQETNLQPPYVELSWEANSEADLAGYSVYRSEDSGTQGKRITSELLLSPVFRDTTVAAGRRYFYRVTAVDQAGNESSPSAAIAVDLPQQ
jgi:hypothetical protein